MRRQLGSVNPSGVRGFSSIMHERWRLLENWILTSQAKGAGASSKRSARTIALSAVMSALITVLTVTAFPLPPPLSTITLAPVAIFVVSIFLGPRVGFVSALLGSAIGFTVAATVGTVAGSPPGSVVFPVFLAGIMIARGPEGYVIGILRKRNELLAMVAGTVYETLTFFVIDFLYTYPVLLGLSSSFAYLDFGTMIDLVFIIPAVVVLRYLRTQLGARFYDEGLPSTSR